MHESLAAVLKDHLTDQKKKGLQLRGGTLPEQIITDDYGRVLEQAKVRYSRVKVLKAAGLEYH